MSSHQTLKDRIITGIMGAVSSMLFVLSGIIMGGELFDSYRMTALYITILMLAIILFSVINSRAADLILGIGAAIVIVYAIIFRNSAFAALCARGSSQIINEYIEQWNYYFETSYSFPDYGPGGVTFFCMVATTLLIIIIHIASGILRKKTVYVLYPLLFIIGNLLVGYAPEASGMMCMFAGVLLALNVDTAGRCKNRNGCKGYIITAAMSVCIVICSYTFFGSTADKIVGAHDEVREFQKNIELGIKFWAMYGNAGDDGLVTNKSPEYTGEEEIKVTVHSEEYENNSGDASENGPYSSMYLKGYQSSDYYNGKWIYNYEKYNEFCDSVGMDKQGVSNRVLSYEDSSMIHQGEIEMVYVTEDYDIREKEEDEAVEIEYTGVNDDKAYMPYRSYYHMDNEGIHVTEDYRFTRDEGVKKVNVMREICTSLAFFGIDYIGVRHESQFGSFGRGVTGEEQDFMVRYSQYVKKNYLTVPDGQKTARVIADEIKKTYAASEYDIDVDRNKMVQKVAQYLEEHASYTLHPRDNGSEDAIEFFLSESREGFCVHFASAGVMILRSMGIPARYVTGYVAFPRDFEWMEPERYFEASIKDYAAHAWIEVYMEGCGWVPYEMTPAYDYTEAKLPTQWTRSETEARRIKNNPDKDNDKNKDNTNNRGQENAVPSPTPDNSRKESNFQGVSIGIVLTIFVISFAVAAFIAIIIIRKRRYIYSEAVLESRINSGKYNRAVKMINRKIYFTLKDKDKNKVRYIKNDTEFYSELQNVYTNRDMAEWENYAGIVRKAVYSDTAVTKEEAWYCMEMMNSIKELS